MQQVMSLQALAGGSIVAEGSVVFVCVDGSWVRCTVTGVEDVPITTMTSHSPGEGAGPSSERWLTVRVRGSGPSGGRQLRLNPRAITAREDDNNDQGAGGGGQSATATADATVTGYHFNRNGGWQPGMADFLEVTDCHPATVAISLDAFATGGYVGGASSFAGSPPRLDAVIGGEDGDSDRDDEDESGSPRPVGGTAAAMWGEPSDPRLAVAPSLLAMGSREGLLVRGGSAARATPHNWSRMGVTERMSLVICGLPDDAFEAFLEGKMRGLAAVTSSRAPLVPTTPDDQVATAIQKCRAVRVVCRTLYLTPLIVEIGLSPSTLELGIKVAVAEAVTGAGGTAVATELKARKALDAGAKAALAALGCPGAADIVETVFRGIASVLSFNAASFRGSSAMDQLNEMLLPLGVASKPVLTFLQGQATVQLEEAKLALAGAIHQRLLAHIIMKRLDMSGKAFTGMHRILILPAWAPGPTSPGSPDATPSPVVGGGASPPFASRGAAPLPRALSWI